MHAVRLMGRARHHDIAPNSRRRPSSDSAAPQVMRNHVVVWELFLFDRCCDRFKACLSTVLDGLAILAREYEFADVRNHSLLTAQLFQYLAELSRDGRPAWPVLFDIFGLEPDEPTFQINLVPRQSQWLTQAHGRFIQRDSVAASGPCAKESPHTPRV